MSIKVKEDYRYADEYDLVDQKFNASKWGTRHGQCLLQFFTLMVAYSMRSCMGVALVAMVNYDSGHMDQINATAFNATADNDTFFNITNGTNLTEGIAKKEFVTHSFLNALMLTPPYPEFHWTKKVQDTVISAFFWGYMALQIPGGQLAYKFGARYLLFGALSINCFISLSFPIAAYYGGWVFALICRMGQGLSQACILPSLHTILGKWSPLEERGRLSAIIYGGQSLGMVLGLPITGFIASSPLGWPGIFRFYGVLSGTVAAFLWFFLADTPAQHKWISPAERRYIEDSLGQNKEKKQLPVPWKSILTSRGMLGIIAAHIGATWGQLILYSEVPAYMDKVMGVNIKANGLMTALPFLVSFFTNIFFSWITDMLIVKKYLNVTHTRKLANSIGYLSAAIGFLALAYAPKNIYVVESILVATCSLLAAGHLGFHINHIDISPNFAGVMMSISNFCSNSIGSFAPMVAGFILTDVTDEYLWRKVFFIASGLFFITNLIYVLLGTGELADWNNPSQYEKVALSDNIVVKVDNDTYKDSDEEKNEKEQ